MLRLIVITSPEEVADEISIAEALFAEGLEVLHWRKPDWTADQSRQKLETLSAVWRSKVALHQHHSLAAGLGIHRLHFTEQTRKTVSEDQWKTCKQAGHILSTSIHSLEVYPKVAQQVDYLFFGPVFDSISKKNYAGIVDANFRLEKRQPTEAQRIALGGITEHNMPQAATYGFDGVAVLGTIWTKPEYAIEQFRKLKKIGEMF